MPSLLATPSLARRAALIALVACASLYGSASLQAAPQGGYDVQRHPSDGLEFPVPRRWGSAPVQPNEQWILYKFREELDQTRKHERRVRPELWIVDIPWVADPPRVTTGGAEPAPEPPDGGDGEEGGEGGSGEEGAAGEEPEAEPPPPPPLNSLERYLERRMKGWSVAREGEQRESRGVEGRELFLAHKTTPKVGRVAWIWSWRVPHEREVLLVGFCHEDDLEEQAGIWSTIAKRTKLFERDTRERERLERHYARKRFTHSDYRTRVRLALPPEWEAEDTPHYIVVYHTKDQPLVRKIKSDLEHIREAYVELFPSVDEIDAVSTVRVCADRDEYLHYSGLPGSAGYWNSASEELVLYDATKREKGKKTDKTDTFIVLYHEAFHQYIHYSAGELAPHSWFNEGYGDYFSGALVKGGKIRKIGTNPWRLRTIQAAVKARKHVPWEDIIRYEQKDYYKNAGLCYAQGWSMIYFLNTSKQVARQEAWSSILPVYFETLKAAWSEELAGLEERGEDENPEEVGPARLRARTAAVDAAFEGVDLRELEDEWIRFVEDLEGPRGR